MLAKKKRGRDGGDRRTPKHNSSTRDRIASGAAEFIARMALWGLLPISVAERLIRLTGGRNA